MDHVVRDVVRRGMCLPRLRPLSKDVSAAGVRKTFLEYFCERNGHLHIRSSPVFSLKDPTLAFVNAGMNQFKDVFLGTVRPAATRVANSQKCIRIGGKHNDLDQVGRDGSHHTFFEMLGNWSFGDYFKREACAMSWELLTEVYEISPERLYVTYFGGDESLGLEADLEVRDAWRELGVKESHILPFGTRDNFWEGSTTGPCGPSTEIHYDHRPEAVDAGHLVNAGSDRLVEIWNLVFTQYERKADGTLEKLNAHFVDTGMGFERLVAVLQGKTSNYDTDLFLPLFEAIRKYSGHSGYAGEYDGNVIDCSYRILADHSRMIAVALSDGMIPNHQNKVRGVLRKALAVSEKVFHADSGLLKELASHVADTLADAYPEVGKNLGKIHYVIDSEAEMVSAQKKMAASQWKKMVRKRPDLQGLDISETPHLVKGVEYVVKEVLERGQTAVTEEVAWTLFDTLGVPPHVTEELALKLGLKFDEESFKRYVAALKKSEKQVQHSEYSRSRREVSSFDVVSRLEEKKLEPTADYFKHDYRTDASGKYLFRKQETTVQAILRGEEFVDELFAADVRGDEEIGLILDRTQLFSSEGGQESDRGTLTIERDAVFDIRRAVKVRGSVLHFGSFRKFPSEYRLAVDDIGVLELDEERRLRLMRNHTALHLMNAALREIFPVAGVKFSSVTPDDASLHVMLYKNSCDVEEVEKMEKFVRDFILHGVPVKRKILNHGQFQRLEDVVFVPGEPILGAEIPVVEINSGYRLSREYCPGTHVLNTADLKDFVVTKTKKVSYNVRSVEGITGEEVALIREADARVRDKWRPLEEKLSRPEALNPLEVDELSLEVRNFGSELAKIEGLSFVTKFSILQSINDHKKRLKLLEASSVRDHVAHEVEKLFETSTDKFVVFCLETRWNSSTAAREVVTGLSPDRPLMLFSRCGDRVAVQCSVPQEFLSKEFSAKKWLLHSMTGFGVVSGFDPHRDPELTHFTTEAKFTEERLAKALDAARAFAERNVRGRWA